MATPWEDEFDVGIFALKGQVILRDLSKIVCCVVSNNMQILRICEWFGLKPWAIESSSEIMLGVYLNSMF